MTEKATDTHGRWRSVTVAFRVSPEESELINARVAVSGLTKQDYIVNRLLEKDVVIIPNSRVQRALKKEATSIYLELRRIRSASEISPELEARIELLGTVLEGLGADLNCESAVEKEDAALRKISREPRKAKPETGHTDQSTASSPTVSNYNPECEGGGNVCE